MASKLALEYFTSLAVVLGCRVMRKRPDFNALSCTQAR